MDKDTNPSAIISLESDEEMETNAESEATTASQPEKEPATKGINVCRTLPRNDYS